MIELIQIMGISLGAGIIGTLMGGALGLFLTYIWERFRIKSERQLKELVYSSLIEFTSGLMIAIVSFDLLPEVFVLGGPKRAVVGILLGLATMLAFQEWIRVLGKKSKRGTTKTLAIGFLFILSVAMHNFPEGVAVGSSFLINKKLAYSLTTAISLHNIPEGMISAILLKAGGMNPIKTILWVLLVEIPIGLGVLMGGMVGKISPKVITLCIGFSAGAMLYVCVGELLRESKEKYRGRIPAVFNILGMVSGILLSML